MSDEVVTDERICAALSSATEQQLSAARTSKQVVDSVCAWLRGGEQPADVDRVISRCGGLLLDLIHDGDDSVACAFMGRTWNIRFAAVTAAATAAATAATAAATAARMTLATVEDFMPACEHPASICTRHKPWELYPVTPEFLPLLVMLSLPPSAESLAAAKEMWDTWQAARVEDRSESHLAVLLTSAAQDAILRRVATRLLEGEDGLEVPGDVAEAVRQLAPLLSPSWRTHLEHPIGTTSADIVLTESGQVPRVVVKTSRKQDSEAKRRQLHCQAYRLLREDYKVQAGTVLANADGKPSEPKIQLAVEQKGGAKTKLVVGVVASYRPKGLEVVISATGFFLGRVPRRQIEVPLYTYTCSSKSSAADQPQPWEVVARMLDVLLYQRSHERLEVRLDDLVDTNEEYLPFGRRRVLCKVPVQADVRVTAVLLGKHYPDVVTPGSKRAAPHAPPSEDQQPTKRRKLDHGEELAIEGGDKEQDEWRKEMLRRQLEEESQLEVIRKWQARDGAATTDWEVAETRTEVTLKQGHYCMKMYKCVQRKEEAGGGESESYEAPDRRWQMNAMFIPGAVAMRMGCDLVAVLSPWISVDEDEDGGDGDLHSASNVAQLLAGMRAVKELHAAGYVHADIRPANFLFRATTATLIDFDFARKASDSATYPASYNHDVADVTRHKDARGSMEVKREHDVYALGSMMADLEPKAAWLKQDWKEWAKTLKREANVGDGGALDRAFEYLETVEDEKLKPAQSSRTGANQRGMNSPP